MHELNGVSKHDIGVVGSGWEIVYAGPVAYIGRVTAKRAREGELTLCPAFLYMSQIQAQQLPDGRTNLRPQRSVLPIELMGTERLEITIAFTTRMPLAHFDKEDVTVFDQLVRQAMKMQEQIRAERAGIALVSALPPGMPRPPGAG